MTATGAFCSNRQMPEPEVRAVADNLLQALRFFGHARTTSEIHDLPGVSLIFCGLNYAAFNAALLARPIEADSQELSRLIQVSAKQFDSRNLRWTYWVCDDFLSGSLRRDADRIFSRYGLRPLTEAPGMYAETLLPPQRALPPVDVQPVTEDRTRNAFAEIMSVAFEIPETICTAIYGSERAWMGEFRGYVGLANGQSVTTAAALITEEAIMRQVIEQARQNAGVARTVLQSTRSGLSLYERMGYRTVTNFNVYIAD